MSNLPHCADWRNAECYEYTRDLTDREWAWEFLRRNKDYAVDWARASDSIVVLQKDNHVPRLKLVNGGPQMLRWGLIFRRRSGEERQER